MLKSMEKIDYNAVYESLEIKEDNLPDLSSYYDRIRKSKVSYQQWETPERYVNALFWMKFVKKYDWYEIADILGYDYIAVRAKFQPFGWDNSLTTFEECEEKINKIINTIHTQINQINQHPEAFQTQEYLEKEKKALDIPCQNRTKKHIMFQRKKNFLKSYIICSYI